jgi:hypothetical protein
MPIIRQLVYGEYYCHWLNDKLNATPGWKNQILTFGSRIMQSKELLLQVSGEILRAAKA